MLKYNGRVNMDTITKRSFQTQCCVCERVKTDFGWKVPSGEVDSLVSHGYCPRCHAKAMMQIEADLAAMNIQVAG